MDALRIIQDEHRNLRRILLTLDKLLDERQPGDPLDRPFFSAVFDDLARFIDQAHHPKEDACLFRVLRERSAAAGALLDRLEAEHRDMAAKRAAMRGLLAETAGGRTDALTQMLRGYVGGLEAHLRAEEQEVFPLARETFTAQDWADIDRAFASNEDPLFGQRAGAELRELFHRVASLAPVSVGLGAHSDGELGAGASHGEVLLSVSGLESAYGRIQALKGISLEVRRGETVALVGANGAGKTTFLRALSGVQPTSAGRIVFDGEDITRLRADMRVRRGICQSPEGRQVFGPLSIEDNLRLGAYRQPKALVAGELEKVFAMFPILQEKRRLPAGTLSGGQQQMLAIGRALMGRPRLLLLDEPSMGLAPLLVEEVFNVVKALQAQGMTILLVEQNAFAALGIADRGYVLETGAIALSGRGRELIEDEQVRAAYLGM